MAEEIAQAPSSHTHHRAVLLIGSVATGEADAYSDIHLIAYYDNLPTEFELDKARKTVQDLGGVLLRTTGADEIVISGVECQVALITVETWERQMTTIIEEFDATSPLQKAIDGVLHGIAFQGADTIAEWQRRVSANPDGLARAMVEAHLHLFPIWRFADRLAARDATVWYYQILVETCQNLLCVLAELNHLYDAKFQFTRMHAFVGQMAIAPDRLADRIDCLLISPVNLAVADVERLVGETVSLVETNMPDIDTTPIRRELGARDKPWPSTWHGTR